MAISDQTLAHGMGEFSHSITEEQHFRYAVECHHYINNLNELTDNRANYLIVANSVLLAALGSARSTLSVSGESVDIAPAIMAASVFVVLSLLLAVWALKPRTFDAGSPIHTSAIASIAVDTYIKSIHQKSLPTMTSDFLRENSVVSRIINVKSRYVTLSGYSMFVGIAAGVATTAWLLLPRLSIPQWSEWLQHLLR